VGKSSGLAEKSKNRLRKHQEKHESEREKTKDDAVVEISMNAILNLRPEESEQTDPPPVSKAKGKAKVAPEADIDSGEDSGANSEVEEQERRLADKKKTGKGKAKEQGAVKPFAQRDLVSLAFAGDKVVQVRIPSHMPYWDRRITSICSWTGLPRGQTARDSRRCAEGSRYNPPWMGAFSFQLSQRRRPAHIHTVLGLMGWDWFQKSIAETVPRQEGRWHRSQNSRRLWENPRHHL
jgi:hypothetical protein